MAMRRHFIIIIVVIAAVALAAIQAADEPNKASKQQHQMGKSIPGKKLTPAEKEARRAARQKFVDEVNAKAKGKGWTAKLHGKFAELDDDVIVKMQGSVDPSDVKHAQESGGKHAYDVPKPKSEPTRAEYKAMMKEVGKVDPALFASGSRAKRQAGVTCTDSRFDVRDKWPQCADIINNVRDQSLCGSCWAVSSASAYSDRHCIEMVKQGKTPPTADAENAFYSAADVMQCSGGKAGDDACSGGNTAAAWQWYTETGGVTGGNYSMGGCIPYPFPTSTAASAEGIQSYTDTDACPTSCSNADYSNEYSSDKTMASSYNALYATNTGNQWAMVNELQNNGTITASFVVYSDFEHYSTGIYTHVTGVSRGGHAIRLIGFGTVECTDGTSTDYWLGVNSWNTDWGQNGLFQIKRGSDECSIESRRISWGTPTV